MMDENNDSFMISVDLLKVRERMNITVLPDDSLFSKNISNSFMAVLDGVTLATIKYHPDENWSLVDGVLDQDSVDKIGEAIENNYL